MTTAPAIERHKVHEVFDFMSQSCHSALKGFFSIIECIVDLAILFTVLLFIVVSIGVLLNAILL